MAVERDTSRRSRRRGWRYVPSGLVILAGVLLSVVVFAIFRGAEGRDVRQALRLESENRSWAIRRTLAAEMLAMESVRAFYAASIQVERHEFREFAKPVLAGISGMEVLVWAPRVPNSRREAFESGVRRDLAGEFRIAERDAQGNLVGASDRAEYFPVLYVEPSAGNEAAMGFDLASDPLRREAIEAARDSGKVVASRRVALAGRKAGRFGVLVGPVYAGDVTPATVPDRQQRLDGVIAGAIRFAALFEAALAALPEAELDIHVFDRSAPADEQLLYCSSPHGRRCPPEVLDYQADSGPPAGLAHVETLDVGGRRWDVVFTALPGFVAAHRTWLPWGVLAASLAVTGLAGAYLINATRHTLREEGQAAKLLRANLELTREMAQRKEAEQERRRLEAQIQHAQKLESLGVLAGGIAHDFNNILMGVLGNADLALMEVSPVSPVRENLEEIRKAATRAAELCKQMLAYSGKGRFVVEPIDLSEVVREMAHMLEVSISKNAVLKYDFAKNLPAVEADVTQIRQVVMNLITNASEAIGETSGVISIATGARQCDRACLDETYLAEDLPEGLYVTLEVADTGAGMDAETKAKIFDPFYSTKFAGRGLGLAALLGIVRGHRGAVTVDSQVGRGTTFTVLLPASPLPAAGHRPGEPAATSWRGSGTVLLADDEETVRVVGKQMLETIGFEVIIANDGREAVETYRMHPGRIDCVILDLTMPHMDGEAALRQLRRIDPRARVILSSGYDEQEVTARFGDQGLAGFIQKPYQLEDLAARMKQALGRGAEPAPGTSDPLGPDNE